MVKKQDGIRRTLFNACNFLAEPRRLKIVLESPASITRIIQLGSRHDLATNIAHWRKLSPAERKARRWKEIPRQVAASMAFEGELVDLEWLKLYIFSSKPLDEFLLCQIIESKPAMHWSIWVKAQRHFKFFHC
ncbi:MAG: hypothetical protein ABJC04_00705 [Verrucomicrobiota bacterium]